MIALLLLLLAGPPADLTDWRFRSYTSDNGLAHETVLAIHRDQRGFLWVGTMGGLFRFDGRRFDTFQSDPDDSLSLSDSFIHSIFEDNAGYLWITTRNGGINRYDWRTDTFQRHLPGQHIQFLSADAEGTLWASVYRTGLYRFSDAVGTFLPVDTPHSQFSGMVSYKDGPTWFLTEAGLVSLSPYEVVERPTWVENSPMFMSADPMGDIHIYQPGHTFVRVRRPAGITGAVVVASSRMLPTEYPDLYVFGTGNGTVAKLMFPFGILEEIPVPGAEGTIINTFHRDRDGHIWLGTWGKGLHHVLPEPKFNSSVHADGDNFILSMLEPTPGTLWIGTSRGVRDGDRPLTFRLADGRRLREIVPYVMHRNALGAWIGTQHHGLLFVLESELSEPGDVLDAVQHLSTLPQAFIRAIRTEPSGRMWIGTENNGICVVEDPQEFQCEVISTELSDDDIRFILIEQPGVAWVSTFRGGVNRVDWPSRRVTVIPQPGGNGSGLTLQDSTALWIANYGAGLTRVDLRDLRTRLFTTRDGLPVNSLYGQLLDADGTLWISTNKGLSRLDTRTFAFRNFTQDDGLQSNEFNTGAYLAMSDGSLVFGGVGGYNRFLPGDIRDNPRVPQVHITQIRLFDRPLSRGVSPLATDTIRLTHKEHFLSFELAALEFTDPERNRFAYRMVGVDEDWIDAGTRTYVSYPNLSPGEYVFEVRAANNDGVWNETPRRITILIAPPFWKTPWFIVLSVLFCGMAFTWVIREISTRRLRAEMKIQNERERISRDLHDHVGAQLVTILSGLELAGKDRSRSDQILMSVREEAQTTIRQLRDTIWTLKSATITPDAFMNQVQRYVRQVEQISALPIEITSDIDSTQSLSPAMALNAFRIVQEAIQNILKHSGADRASVDIRLHAGDLSVRIADNGRFQTPASDALDGSGLGNMRKRAEEIGGELDVHGTEEGTTVTLWVGLKSHRDNRL